MGLLDGMSWEHQFGASNQQIARQEREKVEAILNEYLDKNIRIRVFKGNQTTGKDNYKSFGVLGYLVNFHSSNDRYLLRFNSKSFGGVEMKMSEVVKITVNRKIIYEHPNYRFYLECRFKNGIFQIWDPNTKEVICETFNEEKALNNFNFYKGIKNIYKK